MIFHLQFPYGFMLFHDSMEIPFVRFKMAGVIVADNLLAYYECGLGFVRQRENLFSCAVRHFYLLHSCCQRSRIKFGRCTIQ